jgi:hypothetical protein
VRESRFGPCIGKTRLGRPIPKNRAHPVNRGRSPEMGCWRSGRAPQSPHKLLKKILFSRFAEASPPHFTPHLSSAFLG